MRSTHLLGLTFAFAIALLQCTQYPQQLPAPAATTGVPPSVCLPNQPLRVLLYSRETHWYHQSNPIAAQVLANRGVTRGYDVDNSYDGKSFSEAGLANYDVIVFLVTSGNTLDPAGRVAFENYMRRGGGFVGVHSASYTEFDWPFMRTLVGARFLGHPAEQLANVLVDDLDDPIVSQLPRPWARVDEWYTFDSRPEENPNLHLLLSMEEPPGYPGPGAPAALRVGRHPIAWRQTLGLGRSFYTALGHKAEIYGEEVFVEHLMRAITWAGEPAQRTRACPSWRG